MGKTRFPVGVPVWREAPLFEPKLFGNAIHR
jgi:hypothetical protein